MEREQAQGEKRGWNVVLTKMDVAYTSRVDATVAMLCNASNVSTGGNGGRVGVHAECCAHGGPSLAAMLLL